MSWLGAALAIALVELAGAAALTLVSREPGRLSMPERLGFSFGLGISAVTLALFVLSLAGIVPSRWTGVLTAAALVAAAIALVPQRARAWLRPPAATPERRPWTAASTALILFLAAVALVVGAVSLLEPVAEWDVLSIWALKAKVLLHEPALASGYFHDASKAYSHLDYPLLWPLAMTWIWTWTGGADLSAVKLLAPALLVALLLSFYGLARRRLDRTSSLLFTALLAGVPFVDAQISRLMADGPLAYFALLAFGSLAFALESGDRDDLRRAGAFAAGLLFTKNEGIALFAILVAAGAVAAARRRDAALARAALVWLAALPVAATAAWFVFRAGIPKLHEDYGARLGLGSLLRNAGRLPEIASGFARYALEPADWLAFWPLAALAPLAAGRRLLRPPASALAAMLVCALGVYAAVFVVTPWPVPVLLETSAARLLLHLAPTAALLAALATASPLRSRPLR